MKFFNENTKNGMKRIDAKKELSKSEMLNIVGGERGGCGCTDNSHDRTRGSERGARERERDLGRGAITRTIGRLFGKECS